MEASKEMESLLKRIYMPSVFYFPYELFPNLSPEIIKELEDYKFFEDFGVLKANGEVGLLRRPTNTLEIFKKSEILEGNIFQLLEMKERLKEPSFNFLLEKYISNVKVWIYVYKWLFDNIDKQILESDKKQKSLFEYHCVILTNHLEQLNLKFHFKSNEITTADIVGVLANDNKILPLDQSLFQNLQEGVKKEELINTKHKVSKQTKKHLLLSEKQADSYLLKTVFNVSLD